MSPTGSPARCCLSLNSADPCPPEHNNIHQLTTTSINPPPHTHSHPFNGPLSRTTRVSRYQKGKTNLDFTEARDSEWQWHQLGNMQVCTSLQTDNHTSTPPLIFLQAGCPSCHPTNSVKALKAPTIHPHFINSISASIIQSDGLVAEWLACSTQAQKGLGSNRSCDTVG